MSLSKYGKTAVRATTAEVTAMELRERGWSYYDVGQEMGISSQKAAALVRKGMKKYQSLGEELAEELVRMEEKRLDMLFKNLLEETIGTREDPAKCGNMARNVEVLLKIMERRAKLRGLDAPEKIQQFTVGMDLSQLSVEELRQEAQRLGSVYQAQDLPQIPLYLPGEVPPAESLQQPASSEPQIIDAVFESPRGTGLESPPPTSGL